MYRKILAVLFVTNLIIFMLIGCSGPEVSQSKPDENNMLTGSDTASNSDTYENTEIFTGCSILPKGVSFNSLGEPVYADTVIESLTYDGTAVELALEISGYSSYDSKAEVFILIDGQLQTASFDQKEPTQFYNTGFSAVGADDNTDLNAKLVTVSFKPEVTKAKSAYEVYFCIYMYSEDSKLLSEQVPEFLINLYSCASKSVCKLTVNDKSLLNIRKQAVQQPKSYIEYKEYYLNSAINKLTTTDDINVYQGKRISLASEDKAYLYLYDETFKDKSDIFTFIFIDGKLYPAFKGSTQARWKTNTKEHKAACFELSLNDLAAGAHMVDIVSFSLNDNPSCTSRYIINKTS